MIKKLSDLASLRNVIGIALVSIVLMVTLLISELRRSEVRLLDGLRERATESAERITMNVSPSIWEVYKESGNRRFSDEVAIKVLDSELLADFAQSIQLYGNFGHLLMGRQKLTNGEISTLRNIKDLIPEIQTGAKIRLPIQSGSMTIGHVVVFYTDRFHRGKLLQDNRTTTIIYVIFESLLLLSLYLLFITTRAQNRAHKAVVELVEIQEQLIEKEKLASLGNLVAGLAHEVNTPLGVAITASTHIASVTNQSRLAIEDGSLSKSGLFDRLDDIEQATKMTFDNLSRVVELLKNFKEVATDQHVEDIREIDLYHYIEEVMSTLSIELRKNNISFSITGIHGLLIETYPGAIAQVITNIVFNAMTHGYEHKKDGHIDINIKRHEDESKVIIRIQDYGKGMTTEVLKRIFEPFYTTKRGLGGTGLGLHIVFNLVHQKLKGKLQVFSTLDTGTLTDITLPLTLSKEHEEQE